LVQDPVFDVHPKSLQFNMPARPWLVISMILKREPLHESTALPMGYLLSAVFYGPTPI
jgi:hypothetical protein